MRSLSSLKKLLKPLLMHRDCPHLTRTQRTTVLDNGDTFIVEFCAKCRHVFWHDRSPE